MNSTTVTTLLPILLPLLVGIITRYAMAGLKKAATAVDRMPAWLQQAIVLAIAGVLSFAAAHGIDLCSGATTCHGLTDVTAGGLTTLISWVIAMVTHNGKKVSVITNGEPAPFRSSYR